MAEARPLLLGSETEAKSCGTRFPEAENGARAETPMEKARREVEKILEPGNRLTAAQALEAQRACHKMSSPDAKPDLACLQTVGRFLQSVVAKPPKVPLAAEAFTHDAASADGTITSAVYSPDGRFVATGSSDGYVGLWSMETMDKLLEHPFGDQPRVAFTPDGRCITARGESENRVKVFDVETKELKFSAEFSGPILDAAPDCRFLAIDESNEEEEDDVDKKRTFVVVEWDGKETKEVFRQELVERQWSQIALSPDGRLFAEASGHSSDEVKLTMWDTKTKDVAMEHVLGDGALVGDNWEVRFSHDGRHLAVGGTSKMLTVFDTESGGRVLEHEHDDWVEKITFSHDGRYVATDCMDRRVRVLDRPRKELVVELSVPSRCASLAFSACDRFFAVGSVDTKAQVLDIETREVVFERDQKEDVPDGCESEGCFVAVSRGGRFVATGVDGGGTLKIVDTSTKIMVREHAFENGVAGVGFSHDGRTLSAHDGEKLIVLDANEMNNVVDYERKNKEEELEEHHFSSDGRFSAEVSEDGKLQVKDTKTKKRLMAHNHGESLNFDVIFSRNSRFVATFQRTAGGSEGEYAYAVRVWDIEKGQRPPVVEETFSRTASDDEDSSPDDVEEFKFDPSARFLVAAGPGEKVRVWDMDKGVRVMEDSGPKNQHSLEFSSDGRYLAGGGEFQTRVWDLHANRLCFDQEHTIKMAGCSLSSDGRLVALLDDDRKRVSVWDATTNKLAFDVEHPGMIGEMAFSPGGRFIATCCQDMKVRVWDTRTKEMALEHKFTDWVSGLMFSHDGRLLAGWTIDKSFSVLDMATKRIALDRKHGEQIAFVAFSPVSYLIATGTMAATDGRDAGKKLRVFDIKEKDNELVLGAQAQASRFQAYFHAGKSAPQLGCGVLPDGASAISAWLSAPLTHVAIYLLLASDASDGDAFMDGLNKADASDHVRGFLESQIRLIGVESCLCKDALGQNPFDLALSLKVESDKVKVLAGLLQPELLRWVQENPSKIYSSGLGESIRRSLSFLLSSGQAASMPRSVTVADFLEAACVRIDQESIGDFSGMRLRPPPSMAGASLEMEVIDSSSRYLEDYDPYLPHDQSKAPLKAEVLLLPGFAGDEALLVSLANQSHPDEKSLFEHRAIRAFMQLRWKRWRFLFYAILVLHLVLLVSFVILTCAPADSDKSSTLMLCSLAGITVSSLLMVSLELSELFGKLRRGFTLDSYLDVWTILGMSLPVQAVASAWFHHRWTFLTYLKPVTAFLLWMYSLHHLEGFQKTSFYVRMTRQSFIDMGPFMLIFLLVLSGFAQAFFLRASEQLDLDAWGVWQMTFRFGVFGDTDPMVDTGFEESDGFLYAFFLAFTLCMPIVLLNILIAIVSDTYAGVNAEQLSAFTRSRAETILELKCAFWFWEKLVPASPPGEFLLIFTQDEGGDDSSALEEVKAAVCERGDSTELELSQLKNRVQSVQSEISTVKADMGSVRKEVKSLTEKIDILIANTAPRPNRR